MRRHKCDACGSTFAKKNGLKVHKDQWCKAKPGVNTRVVNPDFKPRIKAPPGVANDHSGKPFPCVHCGKRFDTKPALAIHIGRMHKRPKPGSIDTSPADFVLYDAYLEEAERITMIDPPPRRRAPLVGPLPDPVNVSSTAPPHEWHALRRAQRQVVMLRHVLACLILELGDEG